MCTQAGIAQSTEPKVRAAVLIGFLPSIAAWKMGQGA
jgi:hypothetical protein